MEDEIFMLFVGLRRPIFPLDAEPDAMFAQLTPDEVKAQDIEREIKTEELQSYSLKLYKKLRLCRPGAVFKMTKTPTGVKYTPKASPEFVISNSEQLTRWIIQHRAAERDYDTAKRIEKEAKWSPDRELLEPFRQAYRRLSTPAQAQLIADMVAYVVRGKPTKA